MAARPAPAPLPADRILLARIGAPHGVRGEVRLFVFAGEPDALLRYAPLTDETGTRTFRVEAMRPAKDHFVARIAGVATRDEAARLTHVGLHVARELLPPPEDDDDFYRADLIGLAAVTSAGEPFGTVVAVHDFGAGDILEIAPAAGGTSLMLPFTRIAVPVVDVRGGRIVVDPAGWTDDGADEPTGESNAE